MIGKQKLQLLNVRFTSPAGLLEKSYILIIALAVVVFSNSRASYAQLDLNNFERDSLITKNRCLGGSSAIVLKTRDYLCVAADTKLVSLDTSLSNAGRIRKIKILRDFAYVNVGLFKDAKGILDVDRIVKAASEKVSDLTQLHKIVVEEICDKIPKAFSDIRHTNPLCYNNFIRNKHNTISIAFIGKVNNQRTIIASHFVGSDTGCVHKKIDTSAELGLLLFGAHTEIDAYLDSNINPLRTGLEYGMEFLIGLEAKQHPDFVALPIDILVLDGNGFRWIRRND